MHTSPLTLATLPSVLDIVEQMIGPNILLYNVTYIIKEPKSQTHVSWHQDLTYWGLSHDDQVSMWLALSPATLESGCMRMIPGSHLGGRMEHETTEDSDNVLLQGQTVSGINESNARFCPLAPGEATLSSWLDIARLNAKPERGSAYRTQCAISGNACSADKT